MNFKEYKSADHWQHQRIRKAGKVTLQQLAFIAACIATVLFFLGYIIEYM